MSHAPARVLVTGANGFIGRRLVHRLRDEPRFADARFVLNDLRLDPIDDPRVTLVEGDFSQASVLASMVDGRISHAFHLAGILGGAAEADPALARRINVDATLSLFDALRRDADPVRLVFASSIAVFGPPLPAAIDDDTLPLPTMLYGAQKRMMEVALEQFSARGWVDGIAIRLPGIVARRDADARLKSAFLSAIFHAVARGEDYVLPVPPEGTTWLISVPACVDAFVHAALAPRGALSKRRAFTLPAQNVALGDLVAGLKAAFPESRSRITYAPDPAIVAQFAAQPPLATPIAEALGFRHDGDIATLIRRAMPVADGGATISDANWDAR